MPNAILWAILITPKEMRMSFGTNLKEIRNRKGVTQEQLAHAIGLKTKAAISKIEKDITNPNQLTISKLAEALGVSPLEFFDFYYEAREKERLAPYQEYLPYLANASEETIRNIRFMLGMPVAEKKTDGCSISRA